MFVINCDVLIEVSSKKQLAPKYLPIIFDLDPLELYIFVAERIIQTCRII